MRATGLYPIEEMRPVNEERMRARWCLGLALSSFVRAKPFPSGSKTTSAGLTSFRAFYRGKAASCPAPPARAGYMRFRGCLGV
jgi:hypothetical protein